MDVAAVAGSAAEAVEAVEQADLAVEVRGRAEGSAVEACRDRVADSPEAERDLRLAVRHRSTVRAAVVRVRRCRVLVRAPEWLRGRMWAVETSARGIGRTWEAERARVLQRCRPIDLALEQGRELDRDKELQIDPERDQGLGLVREPELANGSRIVRPPELAWGSGIVRQRESGIARAPHCRDWGRGMQVRDCRIKGPAFKIEWRIGRRLSKADEGT